MKMTEQEKTKFFRDIQAALTACSIDISEKAIRIFFEEDFSKKHSSLTISYEIANNHPYFSQISQAELTTFDFPGIIFSFTNGTYCIDCSSDEMAEETRAWTWFDMILKTPDGTRNLLIKQNAFLGEKLEQILNKKNRSIKEIMNFIYQHNLIDDVFPINSFKRYHGDFFIHKGYRSFHWVAEMIKYHLFDIQKIDMNLKLENELCNNKTKIIRGKV